MSSTRRPGDLPEDRFAGLVQTISRSPVNTTITTPQCKNSSNMKKSGFFSQDFSNRKSYLEEAGRKSSQNVSKAPVILMIESRHSDRDAIMTELCPFLGGNGEFTREGRAVGDPTCMFALLSTTTSLPRVLGSCSGHQQYYRYHTDSLHSKQSVTEPTTEQEKEEQRRCHFYNNVLLPSLMKEFKENEMSEVPTQHHSEIFSNVLDIDNDKDRSLIAQLEGCVLDLIACRPNPPTPTLYPGELHILPLPHDNSFNTSPYMSTSFAVLNPIISMDAEEEIHSSNFVSLLEKAVDEKLLSKHVQEIMIALQPPAIFKGIDQCRMYHLTPQQFKSLRESLNESSIPEDENESFNCRANLLFLFEFLLSENRKRANNIVMKELPCDTGNANNVLELTMLTSNFSAIMEKNKDLASHIVIHLNAIKHFIVGDSSDEENVEATKKENMCLSESETFYERLKHCLQALVSYIFKLPTLYYRYTVDPTNLVSEPQCHVIMQLADYDNKSLSKDMSPASRKPLLVGSNEFAVIISSAVGPLLSASAVDDRGSSQESWGTHIVDMKRNMSLNQSINSSSSKGEMTVPTSSVNEKDAVMNTPRDQKYSPVKHISPKQISSSTSQFQQELSPHHMVSPSRKLHHRSAQLFSLLLNNILLKRQRYHQSLSYPSTIITEESLVELSSFALHFRPVAECTELYQTLKRFT